MPLVYIAIGFLGGWLVRGSREAPALPSAREMIAMALSGDVAMADFIALVERRALAGDQESLDVQQNLRDARDAILRESRGPALPMGPDPNMLPPGSTSVTLASSPVPPLDEAQAAIEAMRQ